MTPQDARKYVVDKPVYEVLPVEEVLGRHPAMTLMNNNLVPGSHTYIETGWAIAMPEPARHIYEHVHDFDEIVIHMGADPDNQEDLGGEVEFVIDGQPVTINTTSAVFIPKGVSHGPITWKKFVKPHFQLTVMLGADTIADADPGGHRAVE
ncbi:MAG: hypothetical protein MUO19_04490 [Dehalococcoidales bacterium]|nr:hypothetical protein [Dehalococcoidales bacterium]